MKEIDRQWQDLERLRSSRYTPHFLSQTVGTNAVIELRVAMFANVVLNLHPRLGIRLDLLTVGTNQERATKRFDLVQGSLELLVCGDKTIHRTTTLVVQHGNHC